MESSLTERVRVACKAVVDRAIHVRIDYDRIPPYAASLPMERATLPALDPTSHYVGRDDDTVAFLLTLDAINFGSGYFPLLRKYSVCPGTSRSPLRSTTATKSAVRSPCRNWRD